MTYRCILRLAILGLLLAIARPALSQTLLEDSEGNDVLVDMLAVSTNDLHFTANTKDKNLKLKYHDSLGTTASPRFYVAELGAKANDDYSDIFSDGSAAAGVTFALSYIQSHVFVPEKAAPMDWLILKAAYERNEYKLLDEEQAAGDQVFKQEFDGYALSLDYLFFTHGNIFLNIGGQYERANNYDSLSKVTVESQTVLNPGTSDELLVRKSKEVSSGPYDEFNQYLARASFTMVPDEDMSRAKKSLPGFSLYTVRTFADDGDTQNIGVNVFFTRAVVEKKNDEEYVARRNAFFALFFEVEDAFDEASESDKFSDRISVGATVDLALLNFIQSR